MDYEKPSERASIASTPAITDLETDLEKQELENSPAQLAEIPQQRQDEIIEDSNLVVLEGPDDPLNPQNIPEYLKWVYAALLGAMTLAVTFSSSIFSTAANVTAKEFGVSPEVMTLGTSLYLFGFATGPIIAGPTSELFGRKIPLFTGYILFIIFQIPVGVARNVETIMLFRFLQGVASSTPPAIGGGYLADFFPPVERGLAVAVFVATTTGGAIIGPIVGGFVVQSYLGWRWTAWFTMILGTVFGTIGILVLPETYVPVLLQRKAKRLRHETKNWALHSQLDETPLDAKAFFVKYLSRPFVMLFLEPILLLLTLYLAFVYGFIYLQFEAYPISYIEERGYNEGVGALPFIGIGLGVVCGAGYVAWYTLTTIKKNYQERGVITPEDRIYPAIWGGITLATGLFWFAWTSIPSISPWPQIISGIPIGAGLQIVFLQVLSYLIDVYSINANSAIAANTIVRSLVAGGFPLFAVPMYKNLGVRWASSLLGFLALMFAPLPVLFYVYGARIRKLSRYSPTL